jgi:hypothetical protein
MKKKEQQKILPNRTENATVAALKVYKVFRHPQKKSAAMAHQPTPL